MSQIHLQLLTRRYVVVLTVLAAMIAGMTGAVVWLVQQQSAIPDQVNVAGRQRMLTQRLVTLALWGEVTYNNVQLPQVVRRRQLDSLAREIDSSRTQINASHRALQRGSRVPPLPPLPIEFQSRLKDIGGPLALSDSLSQAIAADLRADRAATDQAAQLALLVTQRIALTKALDQLTSSLAERGRLQLQKIQRISALGVALILMVILLMGLYVFRPASRAVERLVEMAATANAQLTRQSALLQETSDELEAQNAELMTQGDEFERQASEMARLTAISDASPDPIVAFHVDGRILYANLAARMLTPKTGNAKDARSALHILDASGRELMRSVAIPSAMRDGLWCGEIMLALEGGVRRPVRQTLIAHRWPDGSVAYLSSAMQDLTAIKKVQAELAEREARYRTVVDSLAEGVVLQDEDGRIIAWNASAEQILGLSADQLSGRTSYDPDWESRSEFDEAMRPEDHPIVKARLEGVNVDGFVTQVRRGDGSRRWLSVNARPIESSDQTKGRSAVATFTDITERRNSEEEHRILSLAVEQSHHAVLVTNAQHKIAWANSSWESLTGYALAEATGRAPEELLHGAHTSEETFSALKARVGAGEAWNGELLIYRRDGTPLWTELSVSPTRDASGRYSGTVAVSQDITARRQTVRDRQRLAAAVSLTADGVAIIGATGTFEFVNHAYARMHQLRPDNLMGSPWQRLYAVDESERLALAISPAVASVGVWQGEAKGWRADSTQFPQALSATQLPEGGLLFLVRDITERVESEERLRHLSVHDEL
ncbi:MAG: PAS domain S-box protein, partial [Phycisphaerae bacterium]|nr:PAS domain S-box protein [Gemmatimonadaceae bacterium]